MTEKIYNINELQRLQEALSNALEITAILDYKQQIEHPDFRWHDLWDLNQLLLQLIKEEEWK
jgi:rubrerythrin